MSENRSSLEIAVQMVELIADRRKLLYSAHNRRTEKLAAIADPTTGGDALDTFKRGSQNAVAVWVRANNRWQKLAQLFDGLERRVWAEAFTRRAA